MTAASSVSQRFPRQARLLRRADFQRVYEYGRRHFSPSLTGFYLLRPLEAGSEGAKYSGPRIGITVGRVLGKAVLRTRIKRRIRNAVRLHLAPLSIPVDVVINPKKSALNVEFAQLAEELRRTLQVVQEKAQPADLAGPPEGRAKPRKPAARKSNSGKGR